MRDRTFLRFMSEDPSAIPLLLLIKNTSINHNAHTNRNIQPRRRASHTRTHRRGPTIVLADKPHAVSPPFLLCASESSHLSQIICFSGCLVNRQLSNVHVGRHTVSVYGHRHFIFIFYHICSAEWVY